MIRGSQRATRTSLVLAAVLAAVACTDLPEIPRNVCGNGVIEDNEDCDGNALGDGTACGTAGENACFFECAPANPQATCPASYTCGLDGRCRQPSGTFVASDVPLPFTVTDYAVGDVNGDHIGDLVGVSSSSVRVRFGSRGADLANQLDTLIRTPTGPAAIGAFNRDDLVDVVVPVRVGLFSLLSQGEVLDPFAYTSLPIDALSGTRVVIAAVEAKDDIDSELLLLEGGQMRYVRSTVAPVPFPEGNIVSKLAGLSGIPTARLSQKRGAAERTDDTEELVLAFVDADKVWIFTPVGADGIGDQANTLSVKQLQQIGLPVGHKVGLTGAHFGDFDRDGCTDLIVAMTNAGGDLAIGLARGRVSVDVCLGQFDAIRLQPSPGVVQVGGILAVADFNGDELDDIVGAQAAFMTRCPVDPCNGVITLVANPGSLTSVPWAQAVVTDINHDGKLDFAATHESIDDVDVLVSAGGGLFTQYRVDTQRTVGLLRTGDFDGDFFPDLAIVESSPESTESGAARLSVIFGAPSGGPSPPLFMGSFDAVESVTTVSIIPDIESVDLVSDLVVVASRKTPAGQTVRGASVLLGDASRRMVAPFLLRDPTSQLPAQPKGMVLGQFDGEEGVDVAVVAEPRPSPQVISEPQVWRLHGLGDGNLALAQGPDGKDLPLLRLPGRNIFDATDALFAAGDLDGDGLDEIVAIDRTDRGFNDNSGPSRMVIVDLRRSSEEAPPVPIELPAATYRRVKAVRLVDIDGDGDRDLIAAFAGRRPAPPPVVLISLNEGGRIDAVPDVSVEVAGKPCVDALPIRASGQDGPELAVLCEKTVAIARIEPESKRFGPPAPTFPINRTDGRFAIGDINGDFLDDLILTQTAGSVNLVRVAVQCSAADALRRCVAGGLSQEPAP